MFPRKFPVSGTTLKNNLFNTRSHLQTIRRFVVPLTPEQGRSALRHARQQLINNENGFLNRQKLRIRLLLMGQIRPMKVDDVVALVSWVFVGHLGFILAGTTTFVSVMLFLMNSFSFEGFVAEKVCEKLTEFTGYKVFFENGIVPRWRDGTIRLENVSIICNGATWIELKRQEAVKNGIPFDEKKVDVNWTYWDIKVDTIDLTLSLWRWLDGKGIVKGAKMKGVRGLCDRKHVIVPDGYVPLRRSPEFGDFELNSFVVEDMLLTIQNPNFRPYTLSIINANLPLFRRQWFLYDWICANSIVGSIDDCLFSVHKPQTKDLDAQKDLSMNWSKLSNLKLYGFPIDHVQSGYGLVGPLSWITKGTIDLDLHFLAPHSHYDEDIFDKILEQVDGLKDVALDKFEAVLIPSKDKSLKQPRRPSLKDMRHYRVPKNTKSPDTPSLTSTPTIHSKEDEFVLNVPSSSRIVMLGKLKIKDLKANVPIVDESLGYMSSALIRPVVGWMNANRTLIPLSLSAQMDLNNFNGSWDVYSSGLINILAEETGRAISNLVNDEYEQTKRLRQIGMWSVAELSQRLLNFLELAGGDRGFSEYNRMMRLLSFFFVLIIKALASDVVTLTPANFDTVVDGSAHVLVEFFAPWCGHCKNLAPVYELVATSYSKNKDIIIAKVDADAEKSLGSRFKVEGFPTLKWFPKGSKTPVDYNGARDEEGFYSFIKDKTGVKVGTKKAPSAVKILSSSTFNDEVLKSGKNTLVEFYAPWCGHCKQLAPIYEKVAQAFELEPTCTVANLDATTAEDIAGKYQVKGYPTIKFFRPDGEAIEYEGGRGLDDFVKYLNKQCGTFRNSDGSLNDKAGKVKVLDEIVHKFVAASDEDTKKGLIKSVKAAAKKANASEMVVKIYKKALEKTLVNSGYPAKEIARLTKMIASGSTSLEKRDEFTIKLNVLKTFTSPPSAESDAGSDEEL